MAFAELDPPEDPSIVFDRAPRAADMNLTPADLDFDVLSAVSTLRMTASRLSDEPSRSTVRELLKHRDRTPEVIIDLGWRPMF